MYPRPVLRVRATQLKRQRLSPGALMGTQWRGSAEHNNLMHAFALTVLWPQFATALITNTLDSSSYEAAYSLLYFSYLMQCVC